MKYYLTSHILSVQHQQIFRSLLYHAKIVLKEAIDIAKVNYIKSKKDIRDEIKKLEDKKT